MKKTFILLCLCLFAFSQKCFAKLPSTDSAYYYAGNTFPVSGSAIKDKSLMKVGKAEVVDILYLVKVGDAGIKEACRRGHITKIYSIEQEQESCYCLYKRYITKVYGE